MGLLDGGVASAFAAAFGGFYLDAVLHRPVFTDDGMGGGSTIWTDEAVKAQLDQMTQAQRQSEGVNDSDQRILVLAHGVAAITTDAEITVGGTRWKIESVAVDPASAYYDLRGRKA